MGNYPAHCLRGLRKADNLTDEGAICFLAFCPTTWSEKDKRPDGNYEISISWVDNDGAVPFMMQKREQSRYGLAALPRIVIETESTNIQINLKINDAVTYDRCPEEGNDYHGNIIYLGTLSRELIKMEAGVFALKSKHIPRSD